jgi:hypothetical protein
MDLSIGEFVLWAVVIWILSQIALGIADGWRMVELKERVQLIKEIGDLIHQVKVEKIGEVEYWYDADSNHFLGQGQTIDDVISHVKHRFPDHIFLIQETGGVSKHTDWRLLPMEDFKKVTLRIEEN